MANLKGVGAWLAVGAIVAATGWGLKHVENLPHEQASTPAPARNARAELRLGTGDIQLDADIARRALRDGTLRVTLADGTSYPVTIERQQTHGGGHWSLVGRVSTAIGGQSMVLTFGPNAVFGVLPMPDGHMMQVETHEGGRVTAAPAGGLTPRRKAVDRSTPDFRVPPVGPEVDTNLDTQGTYLADRPVRLSDEVRIDVLVLYSPEMVALRGDRAIAETEAAHLLAVANQAFIDSGTRVRLHAAGLYEAALPAHLDNAQALDLLTHDVGFASLRDAAAADLAAYVRPHPADDATCGASWLNGGGLAGANGLDPAHAWVVANIAPCGAYVLAHELGHAMGSTHDRAPRGKSEQFGAFDFSFGHRTRSFGTIMADPGEANWVGHFSSMNGADNARSLELMAPAIAEFR